MQSGLPPEAVGGALHGDGVDEVAERDVDVVEV
jgi:hypothetical protein